jgi:TPP-dependent pyruvate/acetoin dehydrogenase alpha subunit
VDKAVGFGVRGERVDGNDVLAVYDVTRRAVEHARAGGGVTLIEAVTFRMKGHAEHDDQRYVPKELLEMWAARDPLQRYERYLLETGLATPDELEAITARISRQLDEDVAFAEANPMPDPASALLDVYAS